MPPRRVPAVCALALAVSAAVTSHAWAGDVRLRPAAAGPVRYVIQLVNAQGRPIIAAQTADGAPVVVRQERTLAPTDAPVLLNLPAQESLARPDRAATYYDVTKTVGGVSETWRVQVPAGDGPFEVATLAGAAAIQPGSVLAGRLLPPTTGAAAGYVLVLSGAALAPVWSAAGGGVTTLAGLLDGPGAYQDGACLVATAAGWGWGACGTGGGGIETETDPVFALSPAAGITGTQITQWGTAYGWGNHALAGYLTAETDGIALAAIAGLDAADVGADPAGTAAGLVGALTPASIGAATAAQGALADSAIQPATAGAAGIQPWVDLGEVTDVAVTLDGRAYRAILDGAGDLLVSAPADGARFALLYLESPGGWELSSPGAALWLDGQPVLIAPAVGEVWEIAIRRLGDGRLLLSARVFW